MLSERKNNTTNEGDGMLNVEKFEKGTFNFCFQKLGL